MIRFEQADANLRRVRNERAVLILDLTLPSSNDIAADQLGLNVDPGLIALARSQVIQRLRRIGFGKKASRPLKTNLVFLIIDAAQQDFDLVTVLFPDFFRLRSTFSAIDPFTIDEQRAIFEAAQPLLANFFRFAFWTGLRTSELASAGPGMSR